MTPIVNFKSRIERSTEIPYELFQLEQDLLIIDQNVLDKNSEIRSKWKFIYPVVGGEALKDLDLFPQHLNQILETWKTPISRHSRIVACGGGSVGDFAGFVASVLKRGVELVHIPSTWLSAIDSAHGGKTALNVGGIKNQIGTFYPAKIVYLIQNILATQPEARAMEALGELLKIALIDQNKMFLQLLEHSDQKPAEILWHFLPKAVELKYDIVLQDPYEQTGVRKILNLGHTLGHVLETHFRRSHGECVLQGLWFALEWSFYKKLLPQTEWIQVLAVFRYLGFTRWTDQNQYSPLTLAETKKLLLQDKKLTQDGLMDFVFLTALGKTQVQAVPVDDILTELQRQGWSHA